MATSDSGGVVGYLGSTRNIVGSLAGLAALGATLPTHIAGPLWPVVVAGCYGIGALLAPREKATFVADGYASALAQAGELRGRLHKLSVQVDKFGARLPDDVLAAYRRIESALSDLLDRAEKLASSPGQLYVVGRIITDYLPTSLQAYANLPRRYAGRTSGGTSPHDELMRQLTLIEQQIDAIGEAVYAGDVDALKAQGSFLQDRFGRSSLDLDS